MAPKMTCPAQVGDRLCNLPKGHASKHETRLVSGMLFRWPRYVQRKGVAKK